MPDPIKLDIYSENKYVIAHKSTVYSQVQKRQVLADGVLRQCMEQF